MLRWRKILGCDFTEKEGIEVQDYRFEPTPDITAYQLFRCERRPLSMSCHSAKDYEVAIKNWFDALPSECRPYLWPIKVKVHEL